MGNVNGMVLAWLLAGSVPGIIIGSLLGNRADDRWVRLAIAIMLLIVGAKLVTQA